MNEQAYGVDKFLKELYEAEKTSVSELEKRRGMLQQALGTFTKMDAVPERISEKAIDSAIKYRYSLETTPGLTMPFYVVHPRDIQAETPIVIILHGHGSGVEEIWQDESPHRGIARQFQEQKAIVVAPELAGLGSRKSVFDQALTNSCRRLASQLLLYQKTLAGLRVFETSCLLDWIKDTFPNRFIGCFGFSGGALIALCTSALEKRIEATVLSGFVSLFQASILKQTHCLDNYVPGLLKVGELTDLLELVQSSKLFIEHGRKDHLFPIESMRECVQNGLYHEWDGAHEVNGSLSVPWLMEQGRGVF